MGGQFGAIVLAGGNSTRMGTGRSKVLEELCGRPVIAWSLQALSACQYIEIICLVCRPGDQEELYRASRGLPKEVILTTGGRERQDSVWNGVTALGDRSPYILIHDGARPMVSLDTINAVCRDALKYKAATAAVPCKDTCKIADAGGFVQATPDRQTLMAVQTPQAFERKLYVDSWRKAAAAGRLYTDDCQLAEAVGERVKLTMGDYRNLKITTPEDLLLARALAGGSHL